jgi:hypothetical protein
LAYANDRTQLLLEQGLEIIGSIEAVDLKPRTPSAGQMHRNHGLSRPGYLIVSVCAHSQSRLLVVAGQFGPASACWTANSIDARYSRGSDDLPSLNRTASCRLGIDSDEADSKADNATHGCISPGPIC